MEVTDSPLVPSRGTVGSYEQGVCSGCQLLTTHNRHTTAPYLLGWGLFEGSFRTAGVGQDDADVWQIESYLSRSLLGHLESVRYSLALGEYREAAHVDVEDDHGGVLSGVMTTAPERREANMITQRIYSKSLFLLHKWSCFTCGAKRVLKVPPPGGTRRSIHISLGVRFLR